MSQKWNGIALNLTTRVAFDIEWPRVARKRQRKNERKRERKKGIERVREYSVADAHAQGLRCIELRGTRQI